MRDFYYLIREKIDEGVGWITARIPYEVYDYIPMAAAGAISFIAIISIILSVSANVKTGNVEMDAEMYQASKNQLELVLNRDDGVWLTDEDKAIMGRSDLILQYKDLTSLDGESVFTNMEKMANVTSDDEERSAQSADESMFTTIKSYAGNFGGAYIKGYSINDPDIMLAAYDSSDAVKVPGEGVSNILVKKVSRTIPSEQYGVRDTKDELIVMGGEDIPDIDTVQKGSLMYVVLGKSTGSKAETKYVCTGIETGSIDGVSANEEDDGEQSGEYFSAEVTKTAGDGTVTYSDGTTVSPDGTVTYKDGTTVSADGTVTYPDGMVVSPDGTISGGTIKEKEAETDDATNSGGETNTGSKSQGGSASVPAFDFTVKASDGTNIEDNLKDALIFFVQNSATGKVTITYWNPVDSIVVD